MKLSEALHISKEAKYAGAEYEFGDTGAIFLFRAMTIDELTDVLPLMNRYGKETAESITDLPDEVDPIQARELKEAENVVNGTKLNLRNMEAALRNANFLVEAKDHILQFDLIVGWLGLTVDLYQRIVGKTGFPEERLLEEVEYNKLDAKKAIAEMVRNADFANFLVAKAFDAFRQFQQQKKT
jgi:hypothetical protein